jgi:hypothetical protein
MRVSGWKAAQPKIMAVKAAQCKLMSGGQNHVWGWRSAKGHGAVSDFHVKGCHDRDSSKAGVLKINIRTKGLDVAPSPAMKGKQARLNVGPPLSSTAPLKVSARSRVAAEPDDDQVAYCAILDSVPSESSSSSSGETTSSESILPSPLPVPNLHVSALRYLRLKWLAKEFLSRRGLT